MVADYPMPDDRVLAQLRRGVAIPAHPLALDRDRKLDERRQRALTRYYLAAGAGGIAMAVHSTQFEIRQPQIGLLRPVLELGVDEMRRHESAGPVTVKIAGICGVTAEAVGEAEQAADLGYDAGLLSLAALKDADDDALIDHCRQVAKVIPLIGFYLQPSVGGRLLGVEFWRRFAQIENVIGIKIAPFDRYATTDVIRAVAEADRAGTIALYTGNDDNIVCDLLGEWTFCVRGEPVTQRIVGGLLGHWAYWTKRAVEILDCCGQIGARDRSEGFAGVPGEMMAINRQITDMNAAVFDPSHNFAGCIPGMHEVLRRQGLLEGGWCLDPTAALSPGQADEITRVCNAYPHLTDDQFVAEHLDEWLS
jgi:dihydrodipicolinate synthase/N-acetylneuraminate lyase